MAQPPAPGLDHPGQSPAPALPIEGLTIASAQQLGFRIARAARDGGTLVQFIGSGGREGTSTVARAFALCMARRAGRRVLLLDLDTPINGQLPWFHRHGVAMDTAGTLPLGNGQGLLRLHEIGGTSLIVSEQVPSPGRAAIAAEAITHPTARRALRDAFDLVIADTPSLAASFDGIALAGVMDATVVVLRAGRTRADAARDICDQLTDGGARLAGIVFNEGVASPPLWRRLLRR